MAGQKPTGGVPPIEPTPEVAPAVPPIEPTPPVAPPVPPPAPPAPPPASQRIDPYASQPTAYGATPMAPAPAQYAPAGYANAGYYAPAAAQGPIGLGVASLVLGICGFLFSFALGLGLFPAIAAVITGHLGYARQPRAKGYAIGGLVTGYIGLVFSLLGALFWIFVIVTATQDPSFGSSDYGNY